MHVNISRGCDGGPGKRCAHSCRNDAGRICVLAAIQYHGAYILPDCVAVKLNAVGREVYQAFCLWNGLYAGISASQTLRLCPNILPQVGKLLIGEFAKGRHALGH